MQFDVPLKLVDVDSSPSNPGAGFLHIGSKNARPVAVNSQGREFDLGNLIETIVLNGVPVDRLHVEMAYVHTSDALVGEYTHTFSDPYASTPFVFLTPFKINASNPTIAELVSVTSTEATIKTYVTKPSQVLPPGTTASVEYHDAYVNMLIAGVLA